MLYANNMQSFGYHQASNNLYTNNAPSPNDSSSTSFNASLLGSMIQQLLPQLTAILSQQITAPQGSIDNGYSGFNFNGYENQPTIGSGGSGSGGNNIGYGHQHTIGSGGSGSGGNTIGYGHQHTIGSGGSGSGGNTIGYGHQHIIGSGGSGSDGGSRFINAGGGGHFGFHNVISGGSD